MKKAVMPSPDNRDYSLKFALYLRFIPNRNLGVKGKHKVFCIYLKLVVNLNWHIQVNANFVVSSMDTLCRKNKPILRVETFICG